MIRLISCLISKSKQKLYDIFAKDIEESFVLKKKLLKDSLEADYVNYEAKLKTEIEDKKRIVDREKFDLEDLEHRMTDRKVELESLNAELRERIRIIEAKARPDQVWISAFTSGVNRAFETIQPLVNDIIEKSKKSIEERTIDESLKRIDPIINERIEKLKLYHLRPIREIESKKSTLLEKLSKSNSEEEKSRRQHYLEAFDWILNGNGVQNN